MRLSTTTEGSGPRVALVHGFTQTVATWSSIAADLHSDHEVVCVDAPGHGRSNAIVATLSEGARLLGEAVGPAIYVGYSMGGRLALRLALDRPDLVRALVLVGATAGIDEPLGRAERRAADDDTASGIERDGVDEFLLRWLALPLFGGVPRPAPDIEARRSNTAAGLASSLRQAGTGTMDPTWWSELARITAPVLVVAGDRDERFTAHGQRMAEAIGDNASFASVRGSGHVVHLEAPAALLDVLRPFLSSTR